MKILIFFLGALCIQITLSDKMCPNSSQKWSKRQQKCVMKKCKFVDEKPKTVAKECNCNCSTSNSENLLKSIEKIDAPKPISEPTHPCGE
jgi:hypothetical protein